MGIHRIISNIFTKSILRLVISDELIKVVTIDQITIISDLCIIISIFGTYKSYLGYQEITTGLDSEAQTVKPGECHVLTTYVVG